MCLPLGAEASVNNFIRCGRCTQWLANKCLWIAVSSYYDAYIALSDDALEKSISDLMPLLFTLLGWNYAQEGAKADAFLDSVAALGIVLRLSRSGEGTVLVDNTDKRRSDLDTLIK